VVDAHGRFVWYELTTTDVEAAKTFYADVMGWGTWDASAPGRPYTLFTAGDAVVAGLMHVPEEADDTGAGPSWIGYVGVDDVDATAERVERLGGVVHVPPTDVGDISRFSVFSDPQTARLALFKWLRQGLQQSVAPHASGCVGWHELLASDGETALAFYGALFGWQKVDADRDESGAYQLFSIGGQAVGGIVTKPAMTPAPFWLYYFNVGDIDAAVQRVQAGGGEVLYGPLEVPGGSWMVQCADPQGAIFALEGIRRPRAVGYFERVDPREPTGARGCRWSW
jgi:predicted enzyme related to lactoylglutathione lyase